MPCNNITDWKISDCDSANLAYLQRINNGRFSNEMIQNLLDRETASFKERSITQQEAWSRIMHFVKKDSDEWRDLYHFQPNYYGYHEKEVGAENGYMTYFKVEACGKRYSYLINKMKHSTYFEVRCLYSDDLIRYEDSDGNWYDRAYMSSVCAFTTFEESLSETRWMMRNEGSQIFSGDYYSRNF